MKESLKHDLLFLGFIICFICGILCLIFINYKWDFDIAFNHKNVFPYPKILYDPMYNFHYECGIYLDFFVIGIFLLAIWLEPNLFKLKIKERIKKEIKKIRENV